MHTAFQSVNTENHPLFRLEGHFEINCEYFLSYFSLLLNCTIKSVTSIMKENMSLYLFSSEKLSLSFLSMFLFMSLSVFAFINPSFCEGPNIN